MKARDVEVSVDLLGERGERLNRVWCSNSDHTEIEGAVDVETLDSMDAEGFTTHTITVRFRSRRSP